MHHFWPIIQSHIRAQVNERTWEQFFQHLSLGRMEDGCVVFELPDDFFVTWFENNYKGYLGDLVEEVARKRYEIRCEVRGQAPPMTNDKMSFAQHGGSSPIPVPSTLNGQHPGYGTGPYAVASPHPGYQGFAPQSVSPPPAPAPYNQGGHYAAPYGHEAPASGAMFAQAAHASAAYPHSPAYPPPPSQPQEFARAYAPTVSLNDRILRAGLNPRYTFDNYVVGPSNQFCHAACNAAGERPARAYNPLFLYGGVGLGKTHLLHAVGIEVMRRFPDLRVTYVTSENFMNDLIHSLRVKDPDAFRTRFRNECDVLLMDDIQFIAGKNSTQEEFFHTFNALHQAHKQIVITSDKMPQELPGLEERLRSRFTWGLIADVQAPEIETRIAIIKKKADDEAIRIDDDVAMFLATHIRSNVRELEGCLIKLKASASLFHREVTIDFAKDQLRGLIQERQQVVSIEQIQKLVANFYNVKVKDLVGKRRHRIVAYPRHVAMFLCRKHTGNSFPEIGKNFGGRDHSTVMNAVRKIEEAVEEDNTLKGELLSIERSILM